MITTNLPDPAERLRSYELVAGAFAAAAPALAGAVTT
jgi:hypothetical protein